MTALPAPAPPRPNRRRQRTRSAILDAGQKLFAARAMEGVTIDDIVAEAEVAKGSFYNHFDDKEGLADAILELIHHDCEYHVLAANRAIGNPAARIARALCVMVAYAARYPDRLKALMSLSERRRSANSPLNAGIANDIADGITAGFFTIPADAGLVIATTLIGAAVTSKASPAAISSALLRALGLPVADAQGIATAAAVDLLEVPQ